MKSWWPWGKKQLIQSLFEGRIPWSHEPPNAPLLRMPPEAPEDGPHPRNAAGPFYVARGWCLLCGFAPSLAPDLIAPIETGLCYFKRQPETPEEIDRAIKAVSGCCCGAFRYSGSDPNILKRLADEGAADSIVGDGV